MTIHHGEYTLTGRGTLTADGRFAVNVEIKRTTPSGVRTGTFYAEDGITYVLRVEAENEAVNLGRNLIKRNLVGF